MAGRLLLRPDRRPAVGRSICGWIRIIGIKIIVIIRIILSTNNSNDSDNTHLEITFSTGGCCFRSSRPRRRHLRPVFSRSSWGATSSFFASI